MIKLLEAGEKLPWRQSSQQASERMISRLRLATLFLGTVSMVLSATSSGAFSTYAQETAKDNILLFVSSCVAYLYSLGCLWSSPPAGHFSTGDSESFTDVRPRRSRGLFTHALVTGLLSLFTFIAFIYSAIVDSRRGQSCYTWYSPSDQTWKLWNITACRFTGAATAFCGLNAVSLALVAYTLFRQSRAAI